MHDVLVIGGGPGGYATAFRAAARGLDVGLVERDEVGGTCLHRGCVPSKAILYVAGVLDEVNRAERLGLRVHSEGIDGAGLDAFRSSVVAGLHQGLEGLVRKRTTAYAGHGRVERGTDGWEVEVTGADGEARRVAARNVVLATGSMPRHLPGIAVDHEVVQTSNDALWFTEPPGRALIIGAGAIGLEFASMWAPMGTELTVVEAQERVLPLEDVDSSRTLSQLLRRRGVEVLTSAMVDEVRVESETATVLLTHDGKQLRREVDRVLVAVGRGPNTADTGAAELGVLDDAGFVHTDAAGQTELPGLWAVGDVRPTLALAHAAFAEGLVVADRIAGLDTPPVNHEHTPRVTYTHPEVASVGLTEAQARERHGDDAVATSTSSLRGNAQGLLAGGDGFVKVVHLREGTPVGALGEGGPVVGVHIVGPHATDLIAEATLATAWEAVPAELAAITHAHPTLYEALGEAFASAAGLPLHAH